MIEVCGRSRNRKMIEGNLRKKEKREERRRNRAKRRSSLAIVTWAQKETNLWEWNRKESRLCGSGQALSVPERPWKWEVCLSAFLVKHLTSSHLSCRRTDLPSPWLLYSLCVKKNQYFFCCFRIHTWTHFSNSAKKERKICLSHLPRISSALVR